MRTAIILCSLFALFAHVSEAQQTNTQTYQGKTVRIIIPSGVGGNPDILGRLIAGELSNKMGGTFLVINRPGASGTIGGDIVAKAAPDGNTLLVAPSSYVVGVPHTRLNMPYDPLRDLVPVLQIVTRVGYVLVSHPSVPAKTVGELIALAKARPSFLTFGSPGIGSGYHLAGELFNQRVGVKMLHVPYGGAPAALNGLLSGDVDLVFTSPLMIRAFAETGKLHIIAVAGLNRELLLPHIPTLNESGLPGFDMSDWQGLFAPAGTPAGIVEYLNEMVSAILSTPEMRALLNEQGVKFRQNTAAEFAIIVESDYDRLGKLTRAIGIKPQ